jgi:SPP1 family holin
MKKEIDLSGVTPQTWARTIIMILALVNQFLMIFGKEQIPFAEDSIYQFISMIATAVSTLWVWWKNNSFSKSAQEGDKVMKGIEEFGELPYLEKIFPNTTDHYHGVG